MIAPSPTYLGLYFGPEARILKDIHCSGEVLQMSKGNGESKPCLVDVPLLALLVCGRHGCQVCGWSMQDAAS